ncbi:MoaD family protein [Thermotoga sp. SG1]|uniref:MoaD family protein n=1 Tax=Thermotoga sp. SG1 TaxID=126739 RepID=UPI000C76AB13|nr:MoaD family protein [Thermotoga sp. SG1]PLV56294.1 molybdopterin synthase sulfur carrier subunit [Thermotoga sp. SG1]
MVKVKIPHFLRSKGEQEIELEATDIRELIEKLEERIHGVKSIIYDEKGDLNPFINIFVNDEDIRFLEGLDTKLKDGDKILIMPAIAGGDEN